MRTRERGAALPTVAIMLVVLLGMAAFAVDLGWIYLNANRVQKTADAAALAGVVNLPTDVAQAQADARSAANANGFGGGALTATPIADNRLQVDLSVPVDTFFLGVFGFDSIDVARRSTAQYILPVPLGSDDRCFGIAVNGLGGSSCPRQGFWAAISAPNTDKWQGDAFTARCYGDEAGAPGWRCANPNPEVRSTGYFYGIEVEPGASNLQVRLYDAGFHTRSPRDCTVATPCDFELSAGGGGPTRYALYRPDNTPYDPSDNVAIGGCSRNYAVGAGTRDRWDTLCTVRNPEAGIYVLQVSTSGNNGGSNQYAIETSTSSGPQPKVYGLNDMSIYNNNLDGFATIDLAEIEAVHAGKTLQIGLFDSGDTQDGNVSLTIVDPSGTPVRCSWSARRDDGVTGPSGSGSCTIVTTQGGNRRYNGMWLNINVQIPQSYTCSSDCFWQVRYSVSGSPTDRTTWKVNVIGNPVRLVPNEP